MTITRAGNGQGTIRDQPAASSSIADVPFRLPAPAGSLDAIVYGRMTGKFLGYKRY